MRPISVAAVFVLVLSACGGIGDGSLGETTTTAAEPTTAPPTTGPSTTVGGPTTTTTTTPIPQTTTTTVPPWTTLPDPVMAPAVLSPALGGPLESGSMCLDFTTDGLVSPSDALVATLTEALGFVGVGVVTEECPAVLRLSVAANRISGNYTNFGVCWPGRVITGETALLVGETVQKTWAIDHPANLPLQISSCPGEDDPIGDSFWACEGLVSPLAEMFGPLGHLALSSVAWCARESEIPSDQVMQGLISLLLEQDVNKTSFVAGWVWEVGDAIGDASVFMPLVPYLIALLDHPLCSLDAESTLMQIAGDTDPTAEFPGLDPAERWWAWWEQQSG